MRSALEWRREEAVYHYVASMDSSMQNRATSEMFRQFNRRCKAIIFLSRFFQIMSDYDDGVADGYDLVNSGFV